MSVNKAILLGNLTRDPEIRSTQNGGEIGNFSIATSEKWKDKESGERKEKAEFHNVTVFGSLVKVLAYIEKGSKIYVEGKITTEKYTDKQGVEKYATKIIANVIDIIKGKERTGEHEEGGGKFNARSLVNQAQSAHDKSKSNGYAPEEEDDSLPPF